MLRHDIGYLPDSAHKFSIERKAKHGSKISRYPELKNLIITLMRDERYSPEMISATLKLKKAKITISTEAIYQYIYSKEGHDQKLYLHLIRVKPKRNKNYGRKTRSNHGIPDRVSISQREKIKRRDFGHFEADLTFFKGSGKINLLTNAITKLNNLPRKRFGFKTPAQMLAKQKIYISDALHA